MDTSEGHQAPWALQGALGPALWYAEWPLCAVCAMLSLLSCFGLLSLSLLSHFCLLKRSTPPLLSRLLLPKLCLSMYLEGAWGMSHAFPLYLCFGTERSVPASGLPRDFNILFTSNCPGHLRKPTPAHV